MYLPVTVYSTYHHTTRPKTHLTIFRPSPFLPSSLFSLSLSLSLYLPFISSKFDFRRLGLRTVAMLMSPWIPAGSVFQEPKGPYNDSQFELTSMVSTVKVRVYGCVCKCIKPPTHL